MSENKIQNTPIADVKIILDKATSNYRCAITSDIKIPFEDANDCKIAVSAGTLNRISKRLSNINNNLRKAFSFWLDIVNILIGAILSFLLTFWASINLYSAIGFWVYMIGTTVLFILIFIWWLLKQGIAKDIKSDVDFIMELFPEANISENIKKMKNEIR